MAAQSVCWNDICQLATLLRDNGDRVLHGRSKLRLTPALLAKLNAGFSQTSPRGVNNDFQVISAHGSQSVNLSQLHFLHDFVQKTVGLTIAGRTSSSGDQNTSQLLDFSRFRSLCHLELHSCLTGSVVGGQDTGNGIRGLSVLRSQLETLVIIRAGYSDDLLWDVLAGDAVSIGPNVMWDSLSQLVVSYCGLSSIGQGLSLATNLQWLDLSHNMISDADAVGSCLSVLPRLCYLNFSYNRLTRVPVPKQTSVAPEPIQLKILLLSHNYIDNLIGVEDLTGLIELNLEYNQIHDHSALQQLQPLYQLQHLKVNGNPICYSRKHRLLTAAQLPPRAVFVKHRHCRGPPIAIPFMLDGCKLNEDEEQAVRAGSVGRLSTIESTSSVPLLSQPGSSSGKRREQVSKKSRKIKEVVIDCEEQPSTFESSIEHLNVKRQMKEVRDKFGESKWLQAQAGSAIQEIMGIQPPLPSTNTSGISVNSTIIDLNPQSQSTPHSSPNPVSRLHAAVHDTKTMETLVLSINPLEIVSDNENETKSTEGSVKTLQTNSSSQYQTADSDTVVETPPDTSSDHSVSISSESEKEEEEEIHDDSGDCTYVVQSKVPGQNNPQTLFLTVTSRHIKEINSFSGRVTHQWLIDTLQSCVLLSSSPCRVHLTFNTVRPSKKEREYLMNLDEAQKWLLPSLNAILEARSLHAMNFLAYRCIKCSVEFSVDQNSRKAVQCPTCLSDLVLKLEEVPVPILSTNEPQLSASVQPEKKLIHSPSDSSIENAGGCTHASSTQQPVEGDQHLPTPICTMPSSAASLEFSGVPAYQTVSDHSMPNNNLRRCESDIDIISNPSQSSIEVLDERSSGTPGRKRSSEERQVVAIPSLLTVPELSGLSAVAAGLTESSSSGSLTDSVCTAYENPTGGTGSRRPAQGLATTVLREEGSRESSPNDKENGENVKSSTPILPAPSFNSMLGGLLQSLGPQSQGSNSPKKQSNVKSTIKVDDTYVNYNYNDFSIVDHRLKLQLHLSVLKADEREVIQLLLRGEVLTRNPTHRFPGMLIITSSWIYVIKITGPEEGDKVHKWISVTNTVYRDALKNIQMLPWGLGIYFSIDKDMEMLFVLRDYQDSKNFFSFLQKIPNETSWIVDNSPSEKHMAGVNSLLSKIVSETMESKIQPEIKLAVLIKSIAVIHEDKLQSLSGGTLIVTTTAIVVCNDELSWLFSAPGKQVLRPEVKQSINNLIEVGESGCTLTLKFLNEAEHEEKTWKLTLFTETVLNEIVTAIRGPWEELFSIALQVNKA